jgi:hypothetical protein
MQLFPLSLYISMDAYFDRRQRRPRRHGMRLYGDILLRLPNAVITSPGDGVGAILGNWTRLFDDLDDESRNCCRDERVENDRAAARSTHGQCVVSARSQAGAEVGLIE